MKLYQLERTQLIPTTIDEAWAFFSSPANLPLITPPSLRFRVTSALPERMYAGLIITYTIMPVPPFKLTWITELTHVEEPVYFVDEQRFGPYRFWHHQHFFEEKNDGVQMTDTVSYSLPFGIFGRSAAGLVRRQLEQIFDFRREYLERKVWSSS